MGYRDRRRVASQHRVCAQINSIALSADGQYALLAIGGTGSGTEVWTPGTYYALAWWNLRSWKEGWRYEGQTGPALTAARLMMAAPP